MHDMCSAPQHKTCIICTGVVWLALPGAIVLNYHLALIAAWSIQDMYKKHTVGPRLSQHLCATSMLKVFR